MIFRLGRSSWKIFVWLLLDPMPVRTGVGFPGANISENHNRRTIIVTFSLVWIGFVEYISLGFHKDIECVEKSANKLMMKTNNMPIQQKYDKC